MSKNNVLLKVLGVCKRVLRDPHDAEDAFQATFLVFVQKIETIRRNDPLANWLHGVAHFTATRLRDKNRRHFSMLKKQAESSSHPFTPSPSHPFPSTPELNELREILDKELKRLPEIYRAPLVLCYLEGKTKPQAAEQLGWPEGTVSTRLARGREMLRNRLTGRGLAVAAGFAAVETSTALVEAALPAELLKITLQAATQIAAGTAAAGTVAVSAVALSKGVVSAMMMSKVKVAAAIVLSLGIIGTGAGAIAYKTFAGGEGEQTKAASDKKEAKKADFAAADRADFDNLQGKWRLVSTEYIDEDHRRLKVTDLGESDTDGVVIWTIQGDKIEMAPMTTIFGRFSRFKIDASKQPKNFDLYPEWAKGRSMGTGIYSLDGDSLKICVAPEVQLEVTEKGEAITKADFDKKTNKILEGDELKRRLAKFRPTEFAAKTEIILMVFKRERLSEKPKKPALDENLWKQTLANGVTVELLGVSEHPSGPKTWWKPDGSPLGDAPYDSMGGKVTAREDLQAREIAIRHSNAPADFSYRTEFSPSASRAVTSAEKNGKNVPNLEAIAVSFPKKAVTCKIRCGVAAGSWETFHSVGPGGGSVSGSEKGTVIFGRARENKGKVGLTTTHDIKELDVRVVAVDKSDKIHVSQGGGSNGANNLQLVDVEFDIGADQVKEFQFQTRAFEWVEFNDVQLQPTKPK